MLTPAFSISQTRELLILTIKAPYTHLKDVEINALECDFLFYSSPYFLRLALPNAVVDDDEPHAVFSADKGEFEIRLCKKEVGQHFPNLDLLGTLLAPRKRQSNVKPNIEILDGEIEDLDDEEDEWLIDQELCPQEPDEPLLNPPKYGFGRDTQGIFRQLKSEFKEIIDLPDPDRTPAAQRDALRRVEEDETFCCDHYLADLMEPGLVTECLAFKPAWMSQSPENVELTAEERESLKKLGNKEFLLSKYDKLTAWLGLVDIIFAYAYNHRTCAGENTVESAWTINKLSATLSWFAVYTNVKHVAISCFRRLLTYPLYRHWDLAEVVLADTITLLRQGRRQLLKCLLEIHSLFNNSEPRYLLNQLYISNYCIWLQKVSDRKIEKLAYQLEQVKISKFEVGFDLEDLEHAALLVKQEEEAEAVTRKMHRVKLNDNESSPSSSYESESTSCSDSDSESLDSDDNSN